MKYLLSTRVTLVLLLLLAGSMGAATFIENDHGTATARNLVYEAWWFEVIMIWLCVNFIAHIGQYKLFSKGKVSLGIFHLAFIVILIGAGVTRIFSKEGIIHIRTGSSENTYYSASNYLQLTSEHGEIELEKKEFIPKTFEPSQSNFTLGDQDFIIRYEEYIPSAVAVYEEGDETFFDMAVLKGGDREDFVMQTGQIIDLGHMLLGIESNETPMLRIWKADSTWMIGSAVHLQVMEMSTQNMGVIHAGTAQPLQLRSLYQWETGSMVIKSINENVSLHYHTETDEKVAKNIPDVLKASISDASGNLLTEGYFPKVSYKPEWKSFTYNKQQFRFTYGPKPEQLPFSLHLNAFELERYPGSQSPSSYASEVMVQDDGEEWPFRIYMNNVLDHKGYRFYQSSYDSDEAGTILSINQDRPGTYLTYLGYTLLAVGMFWTLFAPGSRFSLLQQKLKRLSNSSTIFLCLLFVQPAHAADQGIPFLVPQEKAHQYCKLIVQDLDGRMKPLNTLANEILRKLSGKSSISIPFEKEMVKMSSEQFLLAIQLNPKLFSEIPLIKIDQEKSLEAFQALNISPTDRLSFMDFVDDGGSYLLSSLVEEANQLKPAERNEGHKELLKTDERFNIFYGLLTGDFLRLYPNRLDENNTWYTSQQFAIGFEEEDAVFVQNIGNLYLSNLHKGIKTGDWADAEETLEYIDLFQRKAGEKVYPGEWEIKAELLYNELNLGNRLFGFFWVLGILMLVLGIVKLFKTSKFLTKAWKIGTFLTWAGWVIFTIHLGMRWYIAKHPPWSDGFEMLVFVAWGILLFGLIFSRKSKFTIPLSLLFSGTLLFVGFLDWLNPEITNLMPVLHSYWLKIHVAIIVSSYAPLALAAIIALLSLALIIFKPSKPQSRWWLSMKELIVVNELAITVGLFLLTIGTFLGGVWANESWGRYWAWDPKETWALISVLVYVIVLHLRLVPATRNSIVYNLASLWAFSAIIMTSFGVNYYLSGLHSYAKGDPIPVPTWVYFAVAILMIVSLTAVIRYRKLSTKEKSELYL